MKYKIIVWAVVLVLVFIGIKGLFPDKDSGEYGFVQHPTLHTDTPTILPDTLPAWSDYTGTLISEGNYYTAEADSAHIIVIYNPETEEVEVSGTINDNPITGAEVEIVIPDIIYREEIGDIALVVASPFKDTLDVSVGASYSPLHFSRGRIRFGLVGLLNTANLEDSSIGVTLGYRKGNIGVNIIEDTNTNLNLTTRLGVSFYI